MVKPTNHQFTPLQPEKQTILLRVQWACGSEARKSLHSVLLHPMQTLWQLSTLCSLLLVFLPFLCLWSHCWLFTSPLSVCGTAACSPPPIHGHCCLCLPQSTVFDLFISHSSLCLRHSCLFTSPSLCAGSQLPLYSPPLSVLPLQLSLYYHCSGNTPE